MSAIKITLKKEGFGFLEVTEEKGLKKKTHDSGMAFVGLRMKCVCREKEGEGMTLSINDLEAGPGPFESA